MKKEISKKKEKIVKFEIKKCDNIQDLSSKTRIKLDDIGVFSELIKTGIESAGSIINKGGSGLYYVNTYGGKLCFSIMKDANIGATLLENGDMVQAGLNQVVFNPLTLCSSISNIALQVKLNEINKKIDKVLKSFEDDDKAELKTGVKNLIAIIGKYKYRKNNDKLINSDINKVNNYSDRADKIKNKYIDKINEIMDNPSKWSNKKGFNEIKKYYNFIVQAMALKGFATYMITILEGEFDKDYLNEIKNGLEDEFDEVVKLYDRSLGFIKDRIDNDWSSKSKDFVIIVSKLFTHTTVPRIFLPAAVIETIVSCSRDKEKDKYLSYFDESGRPVRLEYIDKIDSLNKLYNEPVNLLVDREYLYI